MNNKNRKVKLMAGMMAFLLIFSNLGLLGNGLIEVIANDASLQDEKTNLTIQTEITKYVQYNKENDKGVLLNTKISLGMNQKEENAIPIVKNEIAIQVPTLQGNLPDVKVLASSTEATNGKVGNEIDFSENNWKYDSDSGLLTISYENKEENSKYVKNAKDVLEMIYSYPEASYTGYENELELPMRINVQTTLKDENKTVISGKIDKTEKLKDQIGDIVTYSAEEISDIHKGYLYVNKETEFQTKEKIEIIATNLIDKIEIGKKANVYLLNEQEKEATIEYKETRINKNDFDRILGEEGILEIWRGDKKLLSVKYEEVDGNKKLWQENEKGEKEEVIGDILLKYDSGVKAIQIRTTKPQNVGKIEIKNTKVIKPSEELKQVNSVKEIIETKGIKEKSSEENGDKQSVEICNVVDSRKIELKEPINEVEVELKDKNGNENGIISTLNENVLTYTATLKNNSSQYYLLDNPIVDIKFPKEISYIKAENINVLQGEGIKVKKAGYQKDESGTNIRIELSGKQTEYGSSITGGLKLTMTLTLKTSNVLPSQVSKIETIITNKSAQAKQDTTIHIKSKNGLLMLSTYEGYSANGEITKITDSSLKTNLISSKIEQRDMMQRIYLINNHNEDIMNVELIGSLGYSNSEMKSTYITKLKDLLQANEAEISYTTDGEKWVNSIEDINSVTGYKINISKIAAGQVFEIDSSLILPGNLEINEKTYIHNSIKYVANNEQKSQEQTISFYTPKAENMKDSIATSNHNEVTNDEEKKQNNSITATMKATIAGKDITDQDEIYEGQYVRYYLVLKNNSNENKKINVMTNIENAQYYEPRNIGIEYGEDKFATEYSLAPEGETQRTREYEINPGQTVVYDYQVKVKNAAEFVKTINQINVDNQIQEMSMQNKVKDAKLAIEAKYAYNEEKKVSSDGDKLPVELNVSNISSKDLANVTVKVNIPEELEKDLEAMKSITLGEDLIPYEQGKVKIENNQLIWNIDEIKKDESLKLYVSFITKPLDLNLASADISIIASAEIKNEVYHSNDLIKTINQSNDNVVATVSVDKEENELLKDNDEINYTVVIENKGVLNLDNVSTTVFLDEGLELVKVSSITSAEKDKEITHQIEESNFISIIDQKLNMGDSIIFKITAKVDLSNALASSEELSANIHVNTNHNSIKLENTLKIEIPSKEEEHDPEEDEILDQDVTQDDPNNQEGQNEIHTISGLAWLDENKNGLRDENEQLLENIKATLMDAKTKQIVKTEEGLEATTLTDANGIYQFENIKEGTYIVIFEFDNSKYSVTTYRKDKVDEDINSDVVSSKIQMNGETKVVAITDTLNLNKDLGNIDIGFIQNAKFDLKLDKYISKIIVRNTQGTETKQYENANFAKVDLVAKYINSASVIITYKFVITNNGDITGYIDKLSDNLPEGLEFSSELNKDWYKGTDGMIYTSLSGISIEPGKTSEVELILTKQMNEENTGRVTNTASLIQISNLEGIEEEPNSVTDNTSSADLLLSIKTGSPMIYITITLVSIGIIAAGAYFIKKKVLNKVI